ncbi:MAG: DUF4430 domain-containing protein [Planctomycetota bacterium]
MNQPRKMLLPRSAVVWLLAVVVCLAPAAFADDSPAAAQKSEAAKGDTATTVELVIDYGDGVQKRFTRLTPTPQMTILDVLQAAQKHPRGIKFEYRGKGETGFLTRIDDVANEGRGRNWIFRVNNKLGERSFAVEPVRAGDVVSWSFAKYQESK